MDRLRLHPLRKQRVRKQRVTRIAAIKTREPLRYHLLRKVPSLKKRSHDDIAAALLPKNGLIPDIAGT